MAFTTPESIIERFNFTPFSVSAESLGCLKLVLSNFYNNMTLRQYAKSGRFLDSVEICLDIPNKIAYLKEKHPEVFSEKVKDLTEELSALSELKTMQPMITMVASLEVGKKKKKEKNFGWVNNSEIIAKFKDFVTSKYEVTEKPTLKFMDLLKAFAEENKLDYSKYWNVRYQLLVEAAGLKLTRVPNEGYTTGGAYHVNLKAK